MNTQTAEKVEIVPEAIGTLGRYGALTLAGRLYAKRLTWKGAPIRAYVGPFQDEAHRAAWVAEQEAGDRRVEATKREARAAVVFAERDSHLHDHAFNFQPGHIPARARLIAREDRACESLEKARHMAARADGIEAAAERAIYSDDPDAVEQLRARIEALEARRARMKAINTEIRRGEGWAGRIQPPLTPEEEKDLRMRAQWTGWIGYTLTNVSGSLKHQRDRLYRLTHDGQDPPPSPRTPAGQLLAYEAAQKAAGVSA